MRLMTLIRLDSIAIAVIAWLSLPWLLLLRLLIWLAIIATIIRWSLTWLILTLWILLAPWLALMLTRWFIVGRTAFSLIIAITIIAILIIILRILWVLIRSILTHGSGLGICSDKTREGVSVSVRVISSRT